MNTLLDLLIRKYCRRTLTLLEEQNVLTPELRKIVLDAFNDMKRELTTGKFVNN